VSKAKSLAELSLRIWAASREALTAMAFPAGVERAVDEGRGPLGTGREQRAAGMVQKRTQIVDALSGFSGKFFHGLIQVEDVAGRIVMHVAQFADVQ